MSEPFHVDYYNGFEGELQGRGEKPQNPPHVGTTHKKTALPGGWSGVKWARTIDLYDVKARI